MLGLAILLFPDGRLPSPRWRAVPWLALLAIAGLAISGAVEPSAQGAPFTALTNPVGIPGTRESMMVLNWVAWGLTVLVIALGAAAPVVRLGRARGDERQQLKVVMTAGAVIALVGALDMCTWFIWPHGALQQRIAVLALCFSAYAVTAGTAVLRYRLYDMDVAIERTLVYATLTALLAGAYALDHAARWGASGAARAGRPPARRSRPRWRSARCALRCRTWWIAGSPRSASRRVRCSRVPGRRCGPAGRARGRSSAVLRERWRSAALEVRFRLPESGVYVDAAACR